MTPPTISDAAEVPVAAESVERRLEWRVHLAAASPWRAVGAVLAGAIAAGGVWVACGNLLLALATTVVVLGSVAEFLFSLRYCLTERGAEVRNGLSRSGIAWSQVRRCYLLPDGLKLSPLGTPGRLEAFRGVFLRFADNRDQVLQFVREARDAAGH